MSKAFIVSAARTVIAPKGGVHRNLSLHQLAKPALIAAWGQARVIRKSLPDLLVLGNALAAGGNPARLCAIAAFGDTTAAVTLDTQCCSGMDAIAFAASKIKSNEVEAVLAGGVESFSQAPVRLRKSKTGYEPFDQAQFAPDQKQDPDVLLAADLFAQKHKISRKEQEEFAIQSHRKARIQGLPARVELTNTRVVTDPFTRELTQALCDRFLPLIKPGEFAITAATVAPQADGAAVLLLVNERLSRHFPWAIEVMDHISIGCDPAEPALGAVVAAEKLLSELSLKSRKSIASVEVMESFAAQAIFCVKRLKRFGVSSELVNPMGGMLARGHPIGASGAVLVGNLFMDLQRKPKASMGFATIPSAGGLGSAILLKK